MSAYKNVLIVLGCSPKRDGRPSDCMLSRVRKAIHLSRKNNYSRIILSGGPSKYGIPESEVMRVILMNHVPPERLVCERHSRSTVQNAVLCWELLKGKEVKHVTVVTSQHHIPRARYIFRKLYSHMSVSLDFEGAPDSFDPIEKVYYHIKESVLLLWMKVFGIH